jgi:anaerobic selenocysteine-containing dehydrogenase
MLIGRSKNLEKINTVCNMCLTRCGITVYVDNGKIVRVTGMQGHPLNRLCVKAFAIPELVHSPERLTNPLIKKNGRFEEDTWDEALRFVGHKLMRIKEQYGAKAVVVHSGNPFIATQTEKVIRRWSDLYGTPNYTTGASFCFAARSIGHALVCGTHIFPHYSAETKCMIVWGNNPKESNPLQGDNIRAMAWRGAKLIVVDPRRSPIAKEADIHAQIRPGTDCALALSMLNVMINEKLYDKDFVENWTVGFDKLAEHVKAYSPEKVEKITWVPADTIREMANMYASNTPGSISLGISMDHCTNGIQAIRAITMLIAITGNLDIPGGVVYAGGVKQGWLRVEEMVADDAPIGSAYPLFTRYSREQTVAPAIDQMITEKPYPIKSLLIAGCNAAVTWPNTNKVKEGFGKLDLLVVEDIFMTETAKLADVVLPGTTFLERQDLRHWRQGGIPLFLRTDRAIEPVGNSMEDWKIWAELGRKMGYDEFFPWNDTDELFEYLLKPSGFSLNQIKQNPCGVYYEEKELKKYENKGFNTPSKKIELYSEMMEKFGYDPLPTFREPAESFESKPDLARDYPLTLITGARTIAYLHSEYRNLPSLREIAPEPLIEIHTRTAHTYGINDGDMVRLESLRGSILLKAKLTDDIHHRVVSIQHGWSEACSNLLTDDMSRDPISAYPGFRSVLCRISKNREKVPNKTHTRGSRNEYM